MFFLFLISLTRIRCNRDLLAIIAIFKKGSICDQPLNPSSNLLNGSYTIASGQKRSFKLSISLHLTSLKHSSTIFLLVQNFFLDLISLFNYDHLRPNKQIIISFTVIVNNS